MKHYDKVEPNDYWKNLREWDFIRELNESRADLVAKSKGKDGATISCNSNTTNGNKQPKLQPLPDTFTSHREYCALWSPLIMTETRAQLLSDAIFDIPYWKSKPEKRPIRVRLELRKKDLNKEYDPVGVVVREVTGEDSQERMFMANDVVCLVREERTIWDAAKGTLQPSQRVSCIVGHLEYTRRSIDNLVITISRKIWKEIGQGEMTLLKLGCNITSLREFTALCRMDRLPLADYILCGKMNVKKEKEGATEDEVMDVDKEKEMKKHILEKMGGPIALGKGFVDYARQKFNLSQLKGISASAAEYGNGGFTLVSEHHYECFLLGLTWSNYQLPEYFFITVDQRSAWYW